MCAACCSGPGFGQAEMLDFSCVYQALYRPVTSSIGSRINPDINSVSAQPLEHRIGNLDDMIRAAVEANRSRTCDRIDIPPELGRDCDLLPHRSQCLSN
jgi:hypothetical protein